MKNPPWSRDELILALDLYFEHRQAPPGKASPDVRDLSRVLNTMGRQVEDRLEDYRNPNGVCMKLMNFRSMDPLWLSAGRTGLTGVGGGDREVWRQFSEDHVSLAAAAKAIRANVASGDPSPVEDESFYAEAEEGRLLSSQHFRRERKRALVEKKKQQVLRATGSLACEVCGFDFEKVYGDRGKGFIEAHHTKPLASLTPGCRTTTRDLAILCANCHRMIHSRRPWLTLSELKALISTARIPVG